MARYDGGWGRFPGGPRYDDPFRPYGPPPGGRQGPHEGWAGGGPGGGEEFWDPGTVYGPARYGLGPYHERLRRQRRPDDELREEVEEALFFDTWVDADAITVEVSDGIVTLRGELPDFDEIRYATDDAWDVDGVRGVRSELSIRRGGAEQGSAGGASPVLEAASGSGGAGTQPSGAATGRGGAATRRAGKKPSAS